MAWVNAEAGQLGQTHLTSVDDTAQYPVGTKVKGRNTETGAWGEFVYAGTDGNQFAGGVHLFLANWNTDRLEANDIGMVGVAVSNASINQYAWFCVYGTIDVSTNGGVTAGAAAYATASVGKIDDAVVAGDRIKGMFIQETVGSAGTAECFLNYPFVDDIAD